MTIEIGSTPRQIAALEAILRPLIAEESEVVTTIEVEGADAEGWYYRFTNGADKSAWHGSYAIESEALGAALNYRDTMLEEIEDVFPGLQIAARQALGLAR